MLKLLMKPQKSLLDMDHHYQMSTVGGANVA
jgi:hypothetical protein